MAEHWKPIRDFEGIYEVSDHGRVRSLPRVSEDSLGRFYNVEGGILNPTTRADGIRMVNLSAGGKRRSGRSVARLVLEAFDRPPASGEFADYLNGDRADTRLSNLRWAPFAERFDRVEVCVRGHRLEAPNLTEWGQKVGKRKCLACSRARSWLGWKGGGYDEARLKSLADGYFERLSR